MCNRRKRTNADVADDGVRGMREKQENERRGKGLKQYIADRRLAAVSLVLGF